MKHRMTACILSALMTLSAVTYTAAPAAGEEKEVEYGTVTVTVYDGETGELFQNDQVRIMVAGFNAESASMFTPHYIYGMWYTSETNPYTASEVELYPGWKYEITVMNDSEVYSENPYYYAIDESRSDTVIQFSDGVAEPVNIYIVKKYDAGAVGGIWIYRGTTAAEQYPVFEQYYPDDDGSYAHRRICCQSALDKTLSYGDILVTEDIVNPSNRILTEDVAWTENGSCYDLPDIRSLTVMSEDPFSTVYSSETHRLVLRDEHNSVFIYSADNSDLQTAVSLDSARRGDTIRFAFYENTPVLPLEEPQHQYPAGDVSGDFMLRLNDAVLLQKWLLAEPDTVLADWKAGDLDGNGRLNGADLTLLKRALLAQEQLAHCTLTIKTTNVKTDSSGAALDETVESQEVYTIYEGDSFSEDSRVLIQNVPPEATTAGFIFRFREITAEGVSFLYTARDGTLEHRFAAYDEAGDYLSRIVSYNGYNNTYTLTFSDCVHPSEPSE